MTEKVTTPTIEAPEVEETINPVTRHPFAGTDLDPARKGYQERTVRLAVSELWPDGQLPKDVALRNRAIWKWYERKGIPRGYWPSKRHLRRVFNGR